MTEVQVGECLNDVGGLVRVRPGTDQDPTREVWIFPDETVATWRKIRIDKCSTKEYSTFDIRVRWNGNEREFNHLSREELIEPDVRRAVIHWRPGSVIYHHLKIYEEV